MDLWALGCIIYEIHIGRTPFFGRSLGDIYLEVQNMSIEFPSTCSSEFVSIVKALLQMDPKDRIGYNGYDNLKTHPFFAGIDRVEATSVMIQREQE